MRIVLAVIWGILILNTGAVLAQTVDLDTQRIVVLEKQIELQVQQQIHQDDRIAALEEKQKAFDTLQLDRRLTTLEVEAQINRLLIVGVLGIIGTEIVRRLYGRIVNGPRPTS